MVRPSHRYHGVILVRISPSWRCFCIAKHYYSHSKTSLLTPQFHVLLISLDGVVSRSNADCFSWCRIVSTFAEILIQIGATGSQPVTQTNRAPFSSTYTPVTRPLTVRASSSAKSQLSPHRPRDRNAPSPKLVTTTVALRHRSIWSRGGDDGGHDGGIDRAGTRKGRGLPCDETNHSSALLPLHCKFTNPPLTPTSTSDGLPWWCTLVAAGSECTTTCRGPDAREGRVRG